MPEESENVGEPFLSQQHPKSKRWAVFEDDGRSGWLYMTKQGSQDVVSDCWIYNRVRAPEAAQIEEFRDGPPPAIKGVVGEGALVEAPDEADMRFVWSEDGHSVAFIVEDIPLGFIVKPGKRGYCRNLLESCPWGKVWDQALFEKIFDRKG